MSKLVTLTLVCLVSILNGQELILEWQQNFEPETEYNTFDKPLKLGDRLIFDHSKSGGGVYPDSHSIVVVNARDGVIERKIEWPDFLPQRSHIKLLKASESEFYFTVERARSYHYGKMNIDGSVMWNDSLQCAELLPALLDNDLILDVSCWEGNNELIRVDSQGAVVWSFEMDAYDARNKIYTNEKDRILWLNSQGLSLWDGEAQLLSIDSTTTYYESYTDFRLGLDRSVISLQWVPHLSKHMTQILILYGT